MPCQRDINTALLIIDRLSRKHLPYAIYGAGKFTSTLLDALVACTLPMPEYMLDDQAPPNAMIKDIPVQAPTSPTLQTVPYILLGTDTFQAGMTSMIKQHIPNSIPLDIHHIPAEQNKSLITANPQTNIYHACGHKTASRWVQRLLSDPRTKQYTGMKVLDYEATIYDGYDPRPILERTFNEAFEPHRIISPMYIPLSGFNSIPKPEQYRAFYIYRDPRDMINSLYFSMRYSHVPIGNIPSLRAELETISQEKGIDRMLHQWDETGYFTCLQEWFSQPLPAHIKLVSFEDLTGTRQALTLAALFTHCGMAVTIQDICDILSRHSFQTLSGRATGQEDKQAHYRKGISGDWQQHFSEQNLATYYTLTGDLTEQMGYTR